MLFIFDLSKDFDLSQLEKNIKYYTSMMRILNVDILKYSIKLKNYHIRLHILRKDDLYSVSLYDHGQGSVAHIVDIYNSIFLNRYFDKHNVTDNFCMFLKTVCKFDKLKAFF